MKADKKAQLIKAIRSTYSSLDSHLDYTLEPVRQKKLRAIHGGKRFHTICVKDYAETLLTLAKLL